MTAPPPSPPAPAPAAGPGAALVVPLPAPIVGMVKPLAAGNRKRWRARIASLPEGASVLRASDGALLGTTPFEIELPRRELPVTIVLRRPGFREARLVLDGKVMPAKEAEVARPGPPQSIRPRLDLRTRRRAPRPDRRPAPVRSRSRNPLEDEIMLPRR
jgi:hypothetical protein